MTDRSGSQIDHLNIAVPDLAAAVEFYRPTLSSIGIVTILQIPADFRPGLPAMVGFGWAETKPFFWLIDRGTVGTNMHVAFTVDTRAQVRAFHETALAAGAEEREAPAVHPEYHADYFGGFVNDPHGINLEAVCHHCE
ncbi:MAG: VOC family protein [Frankiales bacterium]|nr:VOC family protein [Frankiales bacterium]